MALWLATQFQLIVRADASSRVLACRGGVEGWGLVLGWSLGYPGVVLGWSLSAPWVVLGLSVHGPGMVLGFSLGGPGVVLVWSWGCPWVVLGWSLGAPCEQSRESDIISTDLSGGRVPIPRGRKQSRGLTAVQM